MSQAYKVGFKVYFYDKYSVYENKKYIKCQTINSLKNKSNLFFITYKDLEFKKINSFKKKKYVWDIFNVLEKDKNTKKLF